jgi:hypothetical protein
MNGAGRGSGEADDSPGGDDLTKRHLRIFVAELAHLSSGMFFLFSGIIAPKPVRRQSWQILLIPAAKNFGRKGSGRIGLRAK